MVIFLFQVGQLGGRPERRMKVNKKANFVLLVFFFFFLQMTVKKIQQQNGIIEIIYSNRNFLFFLHFFHFVSAGVSTNGTLYPFFFGIRSPSVFFFPFLLLFDKM